MSTTTLGSGAPSVAPHQPGFAVRRRLVPILVAALLGLALAINPISALRSEAAEVSPSTSLAALEVARSQIGVPYLYGGTTPAGFDCSGLTQFSYAKVGSYIPRTAQQQYDAAIQISWDQRQPGDLVFFHTGGSIYHVAVYAGNWSIVTAPRTGKLVQVQTIWDANVLFGRVKGTSTSTTTTSTPAPVAVSQGAFSPGDFTGDGKADVLAIKTTGELFLHRGNGTGGFTGPGTKIGSGWGTFSTVLSPGDFTSDGKADVLAIKTTGELFLYRGNGTGGFTGPGTKIGSGWGTFSTVLSPGDFTSDGKADVLAIKTTGELYLYRGNGTGGFTGPGTKIDSGWGTYLQ